MAPSWACLAALIRKLFSNVGDSSVIFLVSWSSDASKSAETSILAEISLLWGTHGTLKILLPCTRELNFHVFCLLPCTTLQKLANCLQRPPKSGLRGLFGRLWRSSGRSWAVLGALLGSPWARKIAQKIENAPKITRNSLQKRILG